MTGVQNSPLALCFGTIDGAARAGLGSSDRDQAMERSEGGSVEFVMFEDVDGMEVFVNPERVIWVREYPNNMTVISCGHDDKFAVRLAPAHAVAALGKKIR